ncbi:MAG: glycosidase [Syntrophales bacterium]|nr:glycosidase [Syntrophales bacterium]
MKYTKKELFVRYPGNPIIQVDDLPYSANSVFNAGATLVDGATLLLMRVEDRRGISHFTAARSQDGIKNWAIDPKPTLIPDPKRHPEEEWGIEDARITYLKEKNCWAIVYTAYSRLGPVVSLATTKDFNNFERHGVILPPENKDAALFPERINGNWIMIHRPVSTFPSLGAHMWISYSPDLIHWGKHKVLLMAREGAWWDARKIGLSPPPIKTEKGWIILYHGVKTTVSGCIYRLGLALLDLKDPTRVLARTDEWIFAPEEPYEMVGDVDKVVFPCGWILTDGEIRLYYGGADKSISLATAKLSDLLDYLAQQG